MGETPPPFWQKNPKNSGFFSVNRNFGFGETVFFLNDASPNGLNSLGPLQLSKCFETMDWGGLKKHTIFAEAESHKRVFIGNELDIFKTDQ